MKYAIIDYRMRQPEREFLKSLCYELVELPKSEKVYEEISSHMDIFCCKINNALVVEKSCYVYLKSKLKNTNMQIVRLFRENIHKIFLIMFVKLEIKSFTILLILIQ